MILPVDVDVESAVERIARKAPQFVNVPKDDGFTALHIAALNGYVKSATALIDTVRAAFVIKRLYGVGHKNVTLYFCLYLRQLLIDFHNFLTGALCRQFAIM